MNVPACRLTLISLQLFRASSMLSTVWYDAEAIKLARQGGEFLG